MRFQCSTVGIVLLFLAAGPTQAQDQLGPCRAISFAPLFQKIERTQETLFPALRQSIARLSAYEAMLMNRSPGPSLPQGSQSCSASPTFRGNQEFFAEAERYRALKNECARNLSEVSAAVPSLEELRRLALDIEPWAVSVSECNSEYQLFLPRFTQVQQALEGIERDYQEAYELQAGIRGGEVSTYYRLSCSTQQMAFPPPREADSSPASASQHRRSPRASRAD